MICPVLVQTHSSKINTYKSWQYSDVKQRCETVVPVCLDSGTPELGYNFNP